MTTKKIPAHVRSGSAAVAWGMDVAKRGVSGYEGLCLRFVRNCHNVAARDASARIAWSRTPVDERHGGLTPPPGVPVYWEIEPHGHVALSAGGGWCISTDILRRGKADRVRIATISSRWGARYLGWAETVNGARVWVAPAEPEKPVVSLEDFKAAVKDPEASKHVKQVRIVERALAEEGLLDDRWVDGRWGNRAGRAWRRWERRLGLETPNRHPDRASLDALGRRHSFTVED